MVPERRPTELVSMRDNRGEQSQTPTAGMANLIILRRSGISAAVVITSSSPCCCCSVMDRQWSIRSMEIEVMMIVTKSMTTLLLE